MLGLTLSLMGGTILSGAGSASSLDLDFLTGTLDPRVTFTRASSGTYTDSAGVLRTQGYNLLLRSEEFDHAAWSKFASATVTANTALSPTGLTTADTLNFPASSDRINPAVALAVTGGAAYTFSVWLAGSGTVNLTLASSGGTYTFATQAVTLTSEMTRYSVTLTMHATNTAVFTIIGRYNGVSGTGTATSLTAWGAQLETGSTASDYSATTTAANSAPRFDYAITTPTVNLLLQSESFDQTWVKTRASVVPNAAIAPNGALTADKLVEDATASNSHLALQSVTGTPTLVHTFSVYAKAAERTHIHLQLDSGGTAGGQVRVSLTDGTASTPAGTGSPTVAVSNAGGGWWRIAVTAIPAASGTTVRGIVYISEPTTTTYTGDGVSGIYIWGAQLEQSASVGTYVPTSGIPERIGGSTTNLRTNSADMAAVFGTQEACSFSANVLAAPDGTTTADKMVEDGTTGNHRLRSGVTVASVALTHTSSIYMKAAGRTSATLVLADSTSSVANNVAVVANLSAGTIGSVTSAGTGIAGTASISDAGGGWYRVALSGSFLSGTTFATWVALGNYAGDGTSGVYLWGAQLETGSTLGPYVATTTAAATAHATEARGLLIEEARTNSIRNSTATGAVAGIPGSGGTAPTNWGLAGTSGGLTRQIMGSGVEEGIPYVDVRIFGTDGTYGDISFDSGTIAAASGQSWAGSVYLRLMAGSFTNISSASLILYGTPNFTDNGILSIKTITNAPLKGQRLAVTKTLADGTTTSISPRLAFTPGAGAVDITLRIGLPQLEAGAFVTSPVLTTGSATATRAADVAVISTLTPWHNASEGTLMVEASRFGAGAFGRLAQFDDGTTSTNSIAILTGSAGLRTYAYIGTANVSQFDTSASANDLTLGVPAKAAIAYKANDAAFCFNGGGVSTDTSVTLPTVTQLRIGAPSALHGHVRKIRYWRSRRPNADLQTLTAL